VSGLPWTTLTEPAADREYVVMASRLPLARYRHIPSFLRATNVIRKQLAKSEGLVGYALDAHLFSKTFFTVSAWDSQGALERFSHADPHRDRVAATRPRMQPTTFLFWTVCGSELPIKWDEVRRRIAAG
jgi:heme-degrading monooxygenase HmoA